LPCPDNSGNNPVASEAVTTCLCDAGYTGLDGGACTACDPGEHKPAPGADDCVACGPGEYSSAAVSAVCQKCPVDTEQPLSSRTSSTDCTACESGKFSAEGSTSCGTCG